MKNSQKEEKNKKGIIGNSCEKTHEIRMYSLFY